MESIVLVVNPGSSSMKYAVFDGAKLLISAHYEHVGDGYKLTLTTTASKKEVDIQQADFANVLDHFFTLCSAEVNFDVETINGVGVRTVAPGKQFQEHKQLDDQFLGYLKTKVTDAPLHLRPVLKQIEKLKHSLPGVPVFIISDSEFHKSLSPQARNYAIPMHDASKYDIYRFGYHGLSVESVINTLKNDLNLDYRRIIVCHLGSGASITAVKNWKSVETSMGYSPLEGLIMATRSGNIDVVAALELKNRLSLNDDQLVEYLNTKSGLLGLSDESNDIRELLIGEKSGNEKAKFALNAMIYRIQLYIGAYQAILGGVDALIFTATVGERSATIRQRVCEPLKHLGIDLDEQANQSVDSPASKITKNDSKIAVHVIAADEPAEIARQTRSLLAKR